MKQYQFVKFNKSLGRWVGQGKGTSCTYVTAHDECNHPLQTHTNKKNF